MINPAIGAKYGLEMTTFIVENVSVPPEVSRRSTSAPAWRRSATWTTRQIPDGAGMEKAATAASAGGAQMAVGMAMAQQMMNQTGGLMAQQTPGIPSPPPAPTAGGGGADLMNPAQVAQMLGVAESDVVASLESGDLKGKKIGTQWRVTRDAVNSFLRS
jgi:excisionase family DNA binding protein